MEKITLKNKQEYEAYRKGLASVPPTEKDKQVLKDYLQKHASFNDAAAGDGFRLLHGENGDYICLVHLRQSAIGDLMVWKDGFEAVCL